MRDSGLNRDLLLTLISEEKETYSRYESLSKRYQIEPHPIAEAKVMAKLELLQKLLSEI